MKILVVCQHYYPEPFRITDICEQLVQKGHEVTVITGVPNYPKGEIYLGYEKGRKKREEINGVDVHRCFTIPRKTGIIHRILNYYSFAISSKKYVKKLPGDYDVVFVNQLSPVMMASAGIAYKRKHKVPLVLYCLDLWPESLTVGGIKRGSVVYKLFHKISEKIYKQADRLLISSKCFSSYFEDEFGITNSEYWPQYAENLFDPESCKKIDDGYFNLMFAGNVGIAQSVDTIIQAAKLTSDIDNLRWHIVGDGSELENCKKLAEDMGVSSVVFHGRKPLEEMPKYYSMADAMLITLEKNEIISKTLPGKVQTYMAAGKPIIGAIDGEAATVIAESGCGICGEAENAEELAANVRKLLNSDLKSFGENSIAYYRENFEREKNINELQQVFSNMVH